MNPVLRLLGSLYFWFDLFFISALLFPVAVLLFLFTAPFDKRLVILHKYTCAWSYIILKVNFFWSIRVTGRENIDPKETYIMVSNHLSGADIFVLFLLRSHFKWVAKRSLFNFPFIGWNMYLNRYIPLDRASSGSMRRMLGEAKRNLEGGNSVMIFPEGTRSKDGRLQPFRNGAFHLALDNRRPILPVVITGTNHAIRKGGFLINRNRNISARVLSPIPYSAFAGMDAKQVAELVHQHFEKALAESTELPG